MASKVINTILNLKDNTSSKLVKVSKNVSGMSKDMQRASAQAANFTNKFGSSVKKVVAGSAKLVAAGAAIAGAFLLKGAVSTYADFEQSMSNVKALSMATGKTFDDLKNAALEMGKKTSKTAKEAADALGYMSLAGWSAEDSMKGLEPILRLSEAGGSDLAYTSDLVTDSMSAMGVGVDELSGYLDKVAQTSRKSNTNITQMMEAYNGVGGIMHNLNVPLEESGALLGMLANRSIKGSEAGTKLSSLMVNLTTGAGQAGKALSSIGMSAFDSQGKFKGVTKVLEELNQKTKNLSEQQRNKLFAQIGGKTQVDTLNALMSGINTVAADGSSEFEYLKKQIGGSDGALMEMADTMNNTMLGAWKRFQSAVDDFKINFMSTLAPYITPAIDKLAAYIPTVTERATKKIIKIIEQIKGPIKAIFKFLKSNWDIFAAVAAAAVAFTAVSKAVDIFIGVMKVAKVVTALFSGTLALTPFGWVVVAVVGLAAAFVILWKRSEKFRDVVKGLWAKLKEFSAGLASKVGPALQALGDWFMENVLPAIAAAKDMLSALWRNVLVPVGGFLASVLGPIFAAVFRDMANRIKLAFTTIKGVAQGILKAFRGLMDFLTGVFTLNWSKAWQGIKEIFSGIWEGLKTLLKSPFDWIEKKLKNLKKMVSDFAESTKKIPILGSVSGWVSDRVNGHALGTPYFGGGPTRINERGGEIVNLPSGTQIIPHDVSVKAAGGNSVTINLTIQGNVIGNREYMEQVGAYVGQRVMMALGNV